MKFKCGYCGKEDIDSGDRPILKICRKSNYIVAHFTFCNTEHQEKFLDRVYLIRKEILKHDFK